MQVICIRYVDTVDMYWYLLRRTSGWMVRGRIELASCACDCAEFPRLGRENKCSREEKP